MVNGQSLLSGENWLQAASRKLQALMGVYYRLSAFNGNKGGLGIRKFKASCLKKYLVAVNALSVFHYTRHLQLAVKFTRITMNGQWGKTNRFSL